MTRDADDASPGLNARQTRQKDMDTGTPRGLGSKSTSSASIVDNDYPTKTPVHVYADVPDISESPQGMSLILEGSNTALTLFKDIRYDNPAAPTNERLMGSFDTVYPMAPPADAIKPIPNSGQFTTYRTETAPSISAHSPVVTPRHMPSLDLEAPMVNAETSGSRTPTGQQANLRPSVVEDVGQLVEGLNVAFASHPELSEGLRNIVRRAIEGEYWETESARIANAAENVRAAAEETSGRIVSAAQNMSRNAERDTVRIIAEALGGVFRVISELSASSGGPSADGRSTRDHRRSALGGQRRGDRHRDRRPGPDQYMGPPYGPAWHGPPPQPPFMNRSQSWAPGPWYPGYGYGPGPYSYDYRGGPGRDDDEEEHQPNIHETKANLEALKEEYRAGKERFRKQKEERRRSRKELAEKRTEGREQIRQK